jgi:hypothetical protein
MDRSVEERLAFYEKVADDESATWELRMLFARKANWLRIHARLQATGQSASGFQQGEAPGRERACLVNGEESEALLFSPIRMAGNLRERADQACKKLLNKHKQPEGLDSSLKRARSGKKHALRGYPRDQRTFDLIDRSHATDGQRRRW